MSSGEGKDTAAHPPHCVLRFTLAVSSPPSGWLSASDADADRLRAHLQPLALPPFRVRATLTADQILEVALRLPALPGPELADLRVRLDALLQRPTGAKVLASALMNSSCAARVVGQVESGDPAGQLALRKPASPQWPEPDNSADTSSSQPAQPYTLCNCLGDHFNCVLLLCQCALAFVR